jgi:hypothetical protein
MNRATSIFPLLASGISLLFLLSGWLFYDYAWVVIRFPLLAGTLTLVTALLLLVRRPRGPAEREPAPRPDGDGAVAAEFRHYLAVAAILPAVWILGFVPGSAVFLLAFLKWHGTGWVPATAMAAGSALFVHGVFVKLLQLQLPAGILG